MKLNLGCGNQKIPDYIGVDLYPCEAVDVLADLNSTLPFEDNSVHEILLDNVIEHIREFDGLFREMHRVCRNGAIIKIITPHFASAASWIDPTHIRHLSFFSMGHLEKHSASHYTGRGYEVIKRQLSFGGVLGNIGRCFFSVNPLHYEKYWCFIFRPSTLRFTLRVKK
jgi:SAM-dependent methyltransferase